MPMTSEQAETLRGEVLRTLDTELPMLLTVLAANRKGRTNVVADHVERVITRLLALQATALEC